MRPLRPLLGGYRLTKTALAALVALGLAGVVTLVVVYWKGLDQLDNDLAGPYLDPSAALGQILQAVALLTTPHLVYVVVAALAWWTWRQRLFRMARVMIAALPLGIVANLGLKALFQRIRPDSPFASTLTLSGYSYPSGHMTAIVILAILVSALRRKRRKEAVSMGLTYIIAAAAVILVAANRWLMRAHYCSDILGGALVGAFIAWGALAVAQVFALRHVGPGGTLPALRRGPAADSRSPAQVVEPRLAAVVYNPAKFASLSLLRRQVEFECRQRGWQQPLWYETSVQDPGQGPTRWALESGVDLVIAAGGDGTIRAVASVLAGQETTGKLAALGILPSGTGNILAHDLRIPLDQDAALSIALTGGRRPLDLIKVCSPDYEGYCLAVAGMGIDAAAMANTNPDLKKLVGNTAYFLSIMQQIRDEPFDCVIQLDDNEPVHRQPVTAMIGNAGSTQLPIRLFPAARLDDGLFDLLILSPASTREWTKAGIGLLASNVAATAANQDQAAPGMLSGSTPLAAAAPGDLVAPKDEAEPLEFAQGHWVRLESSIAVPWQIDGDLIGETTWLEATTIPGALTVVAPQESAGR